MAQIDSILCPIDFSEFSVNAYRYGESLARHYNARLSLLHVLFSLKPMGFWNVYPDAYEERCRELLAETERKLRQFAQRHSRTEILPEYFVQDGSVPDLILALAESQAVNLVVMGTHGLRGVDRLMLGSVAERVLRRAPCPVLAVREPASDLTGRNGTEQVHFRKILLCMDFSDHAHRAAKYAHSMAKEYGAEVILLHVLEHSPQASDLASRTTEGIKMLGNMIQSNLFEGCRVRPAVRVGPPYQQIIELATETQTDLVIMGVRGHGTLNSAVFGSTAYRVVQLGPCPVLAVHI